MANGDAANSGLVNASFVPLAPTPRWQVPASGGNEFGLVVGNGLVIYSTTGSDVRALDWATGASVWTKTLGAELVGDLILEILDGGQGLVVVPTSEGLLALNLQDGTTAWRPMSEGLLQAKIAGVTTGPDGTLYAVTRTGWVYALASANGKLQWSRQLTPEDEYALPPALTGSTLLITSRTKKVRAFSLSALAQLWVKTLAENLVTPPCASDTLGLAFMGNEKGALYALRLDSGQLAWSAQASDQVTGLAHDNQQVYATSANGLLSAWDGRTGMSAWSVSAGASITAPPLTDGNQVLVTTQAGQIRYFSAATGQELDHQRLTLNDPFYQGAAPAGGWLFLRGSSLYGVSP